MAGVERRGLRGTCQQWWGLRGSGGLRGLWCGIFWRVFGGGLRGLWCGAGGGVGHLLGMVLLLLLLPTRRRLGRVLLVQ